MTPVTVLTGFLGSGKTTLLARLLRTPAFARTAVIINEFGEVGIDHDLVTASDESFVQLETGCLCCEVRGDLEATLADLIARRAAGTLPFFERIVIETSGAADPAPILAAIMAETGRNGAVVLEGVVTCVDAVFSEATLAREPQAARQLAVADRIILTKSDLADGRNLSLLAAIARFNPLAPLHLAIRGEIDPALLIDQRAAASPLDHPPECIPSSFDARLVEDRWGTTAQTDTPDVTPALRHDPALTCITIRYQNPIPALVLPLLIEALAEHFGPDLLRFKAIINVAEHPEGPAIVHGVQHLFHEPEWRTAWPSADRTSRLVLIGRSLSQLWVEALLVTLAAEVAETS